MCPTDRCAQIFPVSVRPLPVSLHTVCESASVHLLRQLAACVTIFPCASDSPCVTVRSACGVISIRVSDRQVRPDLFRVCPSDPCVSSAPWTALALCVRQLPCAFAFPCVTISLRLVSPTALCASFGPWSSFCFVCIRPLRMGPTVAPSVTVSTACVRPFHMLPPSPLCVSLLSVCPLRVRLPCVSPSAHIVGTHCAC